MSNEIPLQAGGLHESLHTGPFCSQMLTNKRPMDMSNMIMDGL